MDLVRRWLGLTITRKALARVVSGLLGAVMVWIAIATTEATGTFWISALAVLGSAVAFYWIMTAVVKWARTRLESE